MGKVCQLREELIYYSKTQLPKLHELNDNLSSCEVN